MLLVDGLTKRYGDLQALDDVGFAVEPGEIVGFLGPNGAGKTTTMRAIMGLVALDAGEVSWQGRPIDRDVRRRFGYMPAERGMYQRMTVRDHLLYYARLSGLASGEATRGVDHWLEVLALTDRAADPVQALSSGNQQRVQLALALLNEPQLLVLDEPFSGLDPVAVDALEAILREQVEAGVALLLSSHQLDLVAEVCSAVVIVDHGRVVLRGDVAELRASTAARYLDVEFAAPVSWQPPTGELASSGDRRYRVLVDRDQDGDAEVDALVADARAHGEVSAYSFGPPDLSEVFLGAVGRDTVEDPATESSLGPAAEWVASDGTDDGTDVVGDREVAS